jgi:phosphopentomutase
MHYSALEYLHTRKPRFLYLAYGETDELAHDGKYGHYLRVARQFDQFVAELWATVQSHKHYRGKTTLLISTDHGRGPGKLWTDHGEKTPDAEYIWIAALGPGVPARGEMTGHPPVTQGQIAASAAALLGYKFQSFDARIAAPLPSLD